MIVVLTEMRFAEESNEVLRALVPGVERFCRQFEGCERFDVSLPPSRPGIVLTTEVWRDAPTLRAHVAVAHHARELRGWHALVKDMQASLFTASPLELAALQSQEVLP
jgi:quinol monooxygenase YgiN